MYIIGRGVDMDFILNLLFTILLFFKDDEKSSKSKDNSCIF